LVLLVSPVHPAFERNASYAGVWQDWGNGWKYCYFSSGDTAWWKDGEAVRFGYQYGQGQWWDYGLGGWNAISAKNNGSAFIGDGKWYDLKNGWSFSYNALNDSAAWGDNNQLRLGYNYALGQWSNYGIGGWSTIGSEKVSSKFIGDGGWYDLKNGWSFTYNAANDTGAWGDNNQLRLRYSYGLGQWWDYGMGGWNQISASNATSKFIGDSSWSDLKSGWSYCYNPGTDTSWWKDGNAVRLGYQYGTGQWYDYGLGGWNKIGAEKASSKFIGDAGTYDLKNGWSYYYSPGTDTAWWKDGSAVRLAYDYLRGQWYDYGFGGWNKIGADKVSSKFIGDGGWYDLKNGWSFYFNPGADTAWWKDGKAVRLAYEYVNGQWYDYGLGGWNKISAGSTTSQFIGDGGWYDLKNGWSYSYNAATDAASWGDNNQLRLRYSYGPGQWCDYGLGGWNKIGAEKASSKFVGDGAWYDLNNGWSFAYYASSDIARWREGTTERLIYNYVTGQWGDKDFYGAWNKIGSTGASNTFIGDGSFHDLGLHDGFLYAYRNVSASYARQENSSIVERFRYDYSDGDWDYRVTEWRLLGNGASQFSLVGLEEEGLRWRFHQRVDPAGFQFNPDNTLYAFIKLPTSNLIGPTRISYFDDAGHTVAEGFIEYGDMGERIVVDKTFVAMSRDWNGSYCSWWTQNRTDSPLVMVVDEKGNVIFKQTAVQWVDQLGDHYVDLRDSKAWFWEDSNGNGKYDAPWNSEGDHIIRWRMQKGGTCAIFNAMNITESVLGSGPNRVSFPESFPDQVLQWYDPDYNPNDWYVWIPACSTDYLLHVQKFKYSSLSSEWSDLVSQVERGRLVSASIDAYQIWESIFPYEDAFGTQKDSDQDGYLDANYITDGHIGSPGSHAVWVRGFERDGAGNITYVIIVDPALSTGAFGRVPIVHFRRSLYDADILDPPEGSTWTNGGANTWKFNPYLYSKTW